MAKFGERLQELRLDRGEKQSDIAKLLNIGERMISYYENNVHFPRDETIIKKLAEHFNVTTDYLLGHTNYTGNSAIAYNYSKLTPHLKREADEYMQYLLYKQSKSTNKKN